ASSKSFWAASVIGSAPYHPSPSIASGTCNAAPPPGCFRPTSAWEAWSPRASGAVPHRRGRGTPPATPDPPTRAGQRGRAPRRTEPRNQAPPEEVPAAQDTPRERADVSVDVRPLLRHLPRHTGLRKRLDSSG